MFRSYKDAVTGREVVKLTADEVFCHQLYFYNKMFTADGKRLLYTKFDGKRSLYMMDMADGSSDKLTDEEGIGDFGANLSADETAIIYCLKEKIIRQSLNTGDKKVLYVTPEGWNGYSNPSISVDNHFLITVEIWADDVIHSKTGGWDAFEPQWRKKPRCRLVYVDLERGTSKVIYEEQCWLGHPQLRPYHNEDISFCHEGPASLIDARLWFIHADGTGMRCLRSQVPGEIITHEFWPADGSQLAFVYRKKQGDSEVQRVKQSILMINPDTLAETHIMDCSVYCHSITDHTGRYMVGDGQDSKKPYIFLADLQEKTEQVLCAHNTSWKPYKNTQDELYGNTQDAHPHPVFTPDGSHILFTSDMDGVPGIYMVSAI
jgi:oligogalacturonide lyase